MMQVPEYPILFGEHQYTARRNAGEERWQVFRDSTFAPVGFIEARPDPEFDGERRLFVFDASNRPIGAESVHSYTNALSHIRAHERGER